MQYASILRKLRKENGLTQQQVADYLHLDRSTYTYHETGHTKANTDILIDLARLYGISIGELAGEPSLHRADTAVIDESAAFFSQLSRDEQNLVLLYRSLEPAQQEILFAQIGR